MSTRLAQGHLGTQLGGAGARTSNLPVTSQPALNPEPNAAPMERSKKVMQTMTNEGPIKDLAILFHQDTVSGTSNKHN